MLSGLFVFAQYLWAVAWSWYGLMAVGAWGVLTAVERLWRPIPKKAFKAFLWLIAFSATFGAWKEQRDIANRAGAPSFAVVDDPSFVPLDPRTRTITGGSIAELRSILENVGGRSARGLTTKIRIADQRFAASILTSDSSAADDIPPRGRAVLRTQIKAIDTNAEPFFMIIVAQFQDPLTRNGVTQCFFRKWAGARDNVFFAGTAHCTRQEAELVLANIPELRQFCALTAGFGQ